MHLSINGGWDCPPVFPVHYSPFMSFFSFLYVLLLSELNKNPVEGFSAGLVDDDDIYQWEVVVIGPQDTLL